ncbi:MAG: head GIN domain-containing protein [Bacteroidales bacterium]
MKRILYSALATALTVITLTTKAQNVTTVDAKDFCGIANSISANVNFYQDANYKVEVIAPQNVIDELNIFVEDGILKLKKKNNHFNWSSSDKVVVNVWAPKYNSLSLNGSGDFLAKTNISTQDLSIKINGSGDVKIESLKVNSLSIKSNGSGDVSIAGTDIAESGEFSINGSGDVDANKLSFKKIAAHVNGSGDIKAWATDEFQAKIVGSGDIEIKGNPTIDAKVVGSGSIKKK